MGMQWCGWSKVVVELRPYFIDVGIPEIVVFELGPSSIGGGAQDGRWGRSGVGGARSSLTLTPLFHR